MDYAKKLSTIFTKYKKLTKIVFTIKVILLYFTYVQIKYIVCD